MTKTIHSSDDLAALISREHHPRLLRERALAYREAADELHELATKMEERARAAELADQETAGRRTARRRTRRLQRRYGREVFWEPD